MADTLSTTQVAARLGLSPDTLRRWAREGGRGPLRPLPLPSRQHRWSRAALERLLDDQPAPFSKRPR